jgi:hypothetical protein
MSHLLHEEYFRDPFGAVPMEALQGHATTFENETLDKVPDLDISVIIQSQDDTPADIERLFGDLERQVHTGGVQTILVNAGNERATLDAARAHGVSQIVHARPRSGFRSDVLNTGIECADNKIVFTTVGHAALSNDLTLSTAVHYGNQQEVGGAFGVAHPDQNASWVERKGAVILGAAQYLKDRPDGIAEPGMGTLASDCSVVKRELILGLGGYSDEFGAGGGDGRMGQQLMEADLQVVRDPLLSVHHTHGFGVYKSLRLILAWRRMGDPRDYRRSEWTWHPNGGL